MQIISQRLPACLLLYCHCYLALAAPTSQPAHSQSFLQRLLGRLCFYQPPLSPPPSPQQFASEMMKIRDDNSPAALTRKHSFTSFSPQPQIPLPEDSDLPLPNRIPASIPTAITRGHGDTVLAKQIRNTFGVATDEQEWVEGDDDTGATPLILAAKLCLPNLVDQLTSNKPELVHERDKSGRQALHWAVILGCELAVYSCLLAGADPRQQDNAGKTPIMLADNLGDRNDIKMQLLLSSQSVGASYNT